MTDGYKEMTAPDIPTREVSDRSWKSCCFTVNVEAVKYFTTYLVSLMVLCFAFYMSLKEEKDRALWVSMISGIVGQYMPSPLYSHVRSND